MHSARHFLDLTSCRQTRMGKNSSLFLVLCGMFLWFTLSHFFVVVCFVILYYKRLPRLFIAENVKKKKKISFTKTWGADDILFFCVGYFFLFSFIFSSLIIIYLFLYLHIDTRCPLVAIRDWVAANPLKSTQYAHKCQHCRRFHNLNSLFNCDFIQSEFFILIDFTGDQVTPNLSTTPINLSSNILLLLYYSLLP